MSGPSLLLVLQPFTRTITVCVCACVCACDKAVTGPLLLVVLQSFTRTITVCVFIVCVCVTGLCVSGPLLLVVLRSFGVQTVFLALLDNLCTFCCGSLAVTRFVILEELQNCATTASTQAPRGLDFVVVVVVLFLAPVHLVFFVLLPSFIFLFSSCSSFFPLPSSEFQRVANL